MSLMCYSQETRLKTEDVSLWDIEVKEMNDEMSFK
jgi:hypothetical protein